MRIIDGRFVEKSKILYVKSNFKFSEVRQNGMVACPTVEESGRGCHLGRIVVKFAVAGLVIAAIVAGAGVAVAGSADDARWIAQCIKDNADQKVTVDVMTKYCTCMTNKMDENETKSVTQWEKTHKTEEAACSKEAGWK